MTKEPRNTRRPQQPRAKATVAKALDAAAEILVEEGIEGLKTNAIAERAGINISTLYAYFADKYAVIAGLLERANTLEIELVEQGITHISDLSERRRKTLEAQLALRLQQPWITALHQLLLASPKCSDLREAAIQNMLTVYSDLSVTAWRKSAGRSRKQSTVLRLLVEMSHSGLHLLVNTAESERTEMLEELHRLIDSYLASYIK